MCKTSVVECCITTRTQLHHIKSSLYSPLANKQSPSVKAVLTMNRRPMLRGKTLVAFDDPNSTQDIITVPSLITGISSSRRSLFFQSISNYQIAIHVLLCYGIYRVWSCQTLRIMVSYVRNDVFANLYDPFALIALH